MSVVVPYLNINNKCIVVWVVEMLSVFFRESNYRVIDLCHFWDETYKLDVLNHPKVSLMGLLGQTRCHAAPIIILISPMGGLGRSLSLVATRSYSGFAILC